MTIRLIEAMMRVCLRCARWWQRRFDALDRLRSWLAGRRVRK